MKLLSSIVLMIGLSLTRPIMPVLNSTLSTTTTMSEQNSTIILNETAQDDIALESGDSTVHLDAIISTKDTQAGDAVAQVNENYFFGGSYGVFNPFFGVPFGQFGVGGLGLGFGVF